MEQEEILESFTFCQLQDGQEHDYRVTAHEQQFSVERDGQFIAEVKCQEGNWKQTEGKKLGDKMVTAIGERIESHYA